MEKLQLVSIVLEFLIVIVTLMIGVKKCKHMFWISFTFLAYVAYDLSRIYSFGSLEKYLPVLFFLATLSAFIGFWGIYKQK